MLYAWFLKGNLLDYDFFQLYQVCSQRLHIKYHITQKTLFDPNFRLFFGMQFSQNDEVLKSSFNSQSATENFFCIGCDPL